jgi:cytochrome c oxidase assembly protein subunit 15
MTTSRSLHRFAILVSVLTILLIFAGGLVTSTGSGLSVPDWPLSFGKFFPKMEGGVVYEHGHRMFAGIVALLTIALAVWLWRAESRKYVRVLGILAVASVFSQAVLGGATVLFRLPLLLSVAHAALAELFLCLTVAIALSTSENWQHERVYLGDSRGVSARTLAVLTTLLIFIQILLGALMRHTGGGLSIPDFPLSYGRVIPPFFNGPILFNYTHRIAGLVVIVFVLWFVKKTLSIARSQSSLRTPALILIGSLLVQVVLGAITIWTHKAPIPTTLHVACGAFTLATCLWLTLNTFRIVSPRPEPRGIQVAAA